jgi:hypothetical protein
MFSKSMDASIVQICFKFEGEQYFEASYEALRRSLIQKPISAWYVVRCAAFAQITQTVPSLPINS